MNATWPSGRKAFDQMREALQRAWQETPAWARSPTALTAFAGFVMVVLLVSLALVVQGVAQRGEQRRQAQAEQVRSLWQCASLSARLRNDDCQTQLVEARLRVRPYERANVVRLANTHLASIKQ